MEFTEFELIIFTVFIVGALFGIVIELISCLIEFYITNHRGGKHGA